MVALDMTTPLSLTPPDNLSEEAYDSIQAAILANVEQGYKDPLLGLSNDTEVELVALAFHDPIRTDRLERAIRSAIREAQQGEQAAKAFSLGSYRKGAQHLRKRIADEVSRQQKLNARNMKVIEGSKGDETLKGLPEDAPVTEAADLYSNSAFLQACAWIRVNRKGRIWFDTHANNFFTDWDGSTSDTYIAPRPVDDHFLLRVHTTLHRIDVRLAKSSYNNSERAVHTVGAEDTRSEPVEWIKSIQWDGVGRLEGLMAKAWGTPDDAYHRAVGRCWFVSMAARIMHPGAKVHTMPVFVGDQGYLKSTALEVIGGKWYGVINVSADKQNDFVGAMAGLIVAEIAELDALSGRRVENSRVKTLLSTAEDRYRPPYGRTTQVFKRTAVLAGTTNDAGWHRDETGARRFWTVICSRPVDVEYLKENREQLFAEALWLLGEGVSWWDVPRDEQERLANEHRVDDPWEERISNALAHTPNLYTGRADCKVPAREGDPNAGDMEAHWGTIITTNRVMTQWLQLPVSQQRRDASLKVSVVMKKLGFTSRSVNVGNKRWVRAWCVTRDGEACVGYTRQKELEL